MSEKSRTYRFALLMASYNRPQMLIRGIHDIMRFDYDPASYHLFVNVTGVTEYLYKELILPSIQCYIDEGRLTIARTVNHSNFINEIKVTEKVDLDKFDYFSYLDDDIFFSSNCLKHVNECINKNGDHLSYLNLELPCLDIHCDQGMLTLRETFLRENCGDLNFFTRAVVDSFLECYHDRTKLRDIPNNRFGTRCGWAEDQIHTFLARAHGATTITPYTGPGYWRIGNRIDTVLNIGTHKNFYKRVEDLISPTADSEEEFLQVKHYGWENVLHRVDDMLFHYQAGDAAKILEYIPDSILKVKWDKWGIETFKHTDSGVWVYFKE